MVKPTDIQSPQSISTMGISAQWLKVVRRAQSMGRHQEGYALLKMVILLDEQGEPQMWTAPWMTLLEPKKDIGELLKNKLSPEEMARVLNILAES